MDVGDANRGREGEEGRHAGRDIGVTATFRMTVDIVAPADVSEGVYACPRRIGEIGGRVEDLFDEG